MFPLHIEFFFIDREAKILVILPLDINNMYEIDPNFGNVLFVFSLSEWCFIHY